MPARVVDLPPDHTAPCPVERHGRICGAPVAGYDPMATCQKCREAGAPARLWAEPCPWARNGRRCNAPVPGIDPMRTCEACRRDWGAPVRVPWRLARPTHNALGQPWPTDGELVLVLANAGLINAKVAPKESARDEVASFTSGPPEF